MLDSSKEEEPPSYADEDWNQLEIHVSQDEYATSHPWTPLSDDMPIFIWDSIFSSKSHSGEDPLYFKLLNNLQKNTTPRANFLERCGGWIEASSVSLSPGGNTTKALERLGPSISRSTYQSGSFSEPGGPWPGIDEAVQTPPPPGTSGSNSWPSAS